MVKSVSVLCTLALLFALAQALNRESRVVRTSQGSVRGYKEDDLFTFYSIPYATAPTGKNKFQAPIPPPVWLETFEAVDKGIVCPQASMEVPGFKLTVNQQENCLIANVFVPDTDEKKLPVLVIVHGGAYQMGSSLMFTPKALTQSKKIITVTFNYRLGVHGFLCLGTKDVPGNAGMKDQVALLKWVKKNIASFGGNPDDVTISGYSAGSSAVDLLQLSKSTRGLFNKVIPESGANVGVWSVQLDPIETAQKFAKSLNFENVDDIYALEEFYKNLPFESLTSDLFLTLKDSTFQFVPCVEHNTGEESFLDDTPVNIMKKGDYNKLPMLYGFANMEGFFRLSFIPVEEWMNGMNEKFSDFLPADLEFENEEERDRVGQIVKEFYFGDKPVSAETIQGYVDYFTDVVFAYPTLRSIKYQLQNGNKNIYLYEYSFVGEEKTMIDGILQKFKLKGAEHCAQTFALYEPLMMGFKDESHFSDRSKRMRAVMRELWLNFITTGAPVPPGSSFPEWPPVSKDRGPHMSLDEVLELRGPLLEKRARFWDGIYDKYYRNPIPPPVPPPKHSEL